MSAAPPSDSPSLISQIRTEAVSLESLLPPEIVEEPEKKDWVKITAIAVVVIGALIGIAGGLCISGIFPTEIIGGIDNALITFVTGGLIAASGGGVVFYKWQVKKMEAQGQQEASSSLPAE